MNWYTYFEQNRLNRRPIPWTGGIEVTSHLRAPLIRSLQRFQIGETGEGHHLQAGAAALGDANYAAAMELFIAEEHEHAHLLERILEELEAPLLKSHWSDGVFMLVRHLMGLKLELVVLLSAEMVAKRYYRALYEGTHDPVLRAIFVQICDDEEGHIAFHCDFLGTAWAAQSPFNRWLIRHAWQLFFWVVALVVTCDHASLFRAVRVPPLIFFHDCRQIFNQTMKQIFAADKQAVIA